MIYMITFIDTILVATLASPTDNRTKPTEGTSIPFPAIVTSQALILDLIGTKNEHVLAFWEAVSMLTSTGGTPAYSAKVFVTGKPITPSISSPLMGRQSFWLHLKKKGQLH